jgi:hypothetical protein
MIRVSDEHRVEVYKKVCANDNSYLIGVLDEKKIHKHKHTFLSLGSP